MTSAVTWSRLPRSLWRQKHGNKEAIGLQSHKKMSQKGNVSCQRRRFVTLRNLFVNGCGDTLQGISFQGTQSSWINVNSGSPPFHHIYWLTSIEMWLIWTMIKSNGVNSFVINAAHSITVTGQLLSTWQSRPSISLKICQSLFLKAVGSFFKLS